MKSLSAALQKVQGPRLVVVAADAMDRELIREWASSGHLPNLARLLQDATQVEVGGAAGEWFNGSVWPTMATGCSPAKHGSYYTHQVSPGRYTPTRIKADQLGRLPFWSYLSPDNGPAFLFDVPTIAPDRRLKGAMISHWNAHSDFWPFCTQPPELKEEIVRLARPPSSASLLTVPKSGRDWARYEARLRAAVRARLKVTLAFLPREAWRFFMVVFEETHLAGHRFWGFQDSRHPSYNTPIGRQFRHSLRNHYADIDQAVGELRAAAGENVNFVFLTLHGITANFNPWQLLEGALKQMGLLHERPEDTRKTQWVRRAQAAWRAVRTWVPHGAKRMLLDALPREFSERLRIPGAESLFDPARTKAFLLPTDTQGLIRVNLAGREPGGIVQPGSDYDEVLDQIEREVMTWRNSQTGRPVVAKVLRTKECFLGGDWYDQLPDLSIIWTTEEPVESVQSPRLGKVGPVDPFPELPGHHNANGLLVADGPHIRKRKAIPQRELVDIAPTFLRLLGERVPAAMDGKPIVELISPPN